MTLQSKLESLGGHKQQSRLVTGINQSSSFLPQISKGIAAIDMPPGSVSRRGSKYLEDIEAAAAAARSASHPAPTVPVGAKLRGRQQSPRISESIIQSNSAGRELGIASRPVATHSHSTDAAPSPRSRTKTSNEHPHHSGDEPRGRLVV